VAGGGGQVGARHAAAPVIEGRLNLRGEFGVLLRRAVSEGYPFHHSLSGVEQADLSYCADFHQSLIDEARASNKTAAAAAMMGAWFAVQNEGTGGAGAMGVP
jgi:hypothetical protein